jgi:hypothetical protein
MAGSNELLLSTFVCLYTFSASAPLPTKPLVGVKHIWSNGPLQGSFPRGKWLGHETDHSPLSSAEVKNTCIYTSTPPYVFMG